MTRKLLQHCKSIILLIALVFLSQNAFGQLSNFTLSVNKTDESCTGNGSLSFSVSGTAEGAAIVYSVYLLPNISSPIATLSANILNGLAAGTYRVVATQTMGSSSNFQQQDLTIYYAVSVLQYQLSAINPTCANGQISVNVTQGNPQFYEIISGPVIRAQQTSNVFSNLPPGIYVIRVYDNCSDAVVQGFTLQSGSMAINTTPLHDCELLSCNTVKINFTVDASLGSLISYPLTVQTIVYPPSGAPIIVTQTISSGSSGSQPMSSIIPYYAGQGYSYVIKITDSCGNVVNSTATPFNESLSLALLSATATGLCAKNIKLSVCNYLPPYSVSVISAPAGFNPAAFNSTHPGPFYGPDVQYLSTAANSIPNGTYVFQITDACGTTTQGQTTLSPTAEPNYSVLPSGCNSGQISMPGQDGTAVSSVIMTGAPAAYSHSLPYDVSFNITDGFFLMANLPAGTYNFTVVSVCGFTYYYTIEVTAGGPQPLYSDFRRGCNVGFGSVKLSLQGGILISVMITAAPSTFTAALPNDVSSNIFTSPITGNAFYMNSLPEGIYTFYLKDNCGFERYFSLNLPGYHVTVNDIVVQEYCGSFNIALNYQDNEPSPHRYFLQKFNPSINQWVHPITGGVYTTGTPPTVSNSYMLVNGVTNFNIASIGTFRILKEHSIYANGNDTYDLCIDTIKEFIFTGGPRIVTAYSLPCPTSAGNVVIIAEGLAPLSYVITTKDNLPFSVNNLTSNTFTGLQPGIYNFQVMDSCGNIVNRLFDLTSVPQPSISQSILCDGQNGQLTVQNFTFLNYQWWKGSNTTNILSTTNTLSFAPFSAALNPGTYYVRIYSSVPNVCTDQIISYVIPAVGTSPNAGDGTVSNICGSSGTIDLSTLLTGTAMTGGTWQEITNSGMLIGHNWLPVGIPFGTYQFKYIVDGLCGTSDEAIVEIHFNPIPATPIAGVGLSICDSGTINLSATTVANAVYQWTGPNGFSSADQNPVISAASIAANGIYSVKVIVGGCPSGTSSVPVSINTSPNFTITAGCNGNEYVLTIVPSASSFDTATASYVWTGPENFTSSNNPLIITGQKAGTYNAVVTSINNCSTTSSVVVQNTLCSFPTGLSPNGDGYNDNYDLTGFEVLKFKIFSRWGRMVFEQDDYTNQWHGQDYNGNELPDATYYYYIRLKSGEEKTGWVYVTR